MAAGTEEGHGPAGRARLRADGRLRATRSEGEAAGRGSPSSCWCRRGAGGWRPRRAAESRGFNRKLHTSPRRPAQSPGLGLRPDLRAASSRRRRRRRRRRHCCCCSRSIREPPPLLPTLPSADTTATASSNRTLTPERERRCCELAAPVPHPSLP